MDIEKIMELFITNFVGCLTALGIILIISVLMMPVIVDGVYESTRERIIEEFSNSYLKCSNIQEQSETFTININGEKTFCFFYKINEDINFNI